MMLDRMTPGPGPGSTTLRPDFHACIDESLAHLSPAFRDCTEYACTRATPINLFVI
jgi:hypothetical protein